MSAAPSGSERELELAHVLFIDVVGYSKTSVDDQREILRELNAIVRQTEQFRKAEAQQKLICLPTGDGMALAFFTTPEAPVRCAIEIARALKNHPEIQLRMGVHTGPVNTVEDVNERANVAGAGINMAQRVMDCGDAGHILLSQRVAEDLGQSREWSPLLHDLGECEVKHGVRVHVVNLYTEELGNRQIPARFKRQPHRTRAGGTRDRLGTRGWLVLAALSILVVGSGSWLFHLQSWPTKPDQKNAASSSDVAARMNVAEKSIAVLPFRPLSESNRDEALELGMADTLIGKLSASRELIVATLTAVRKYEELRQDPVTTGRSLRVNAVLEGNLQRVGDRLRVTTRLIKVLDGSSLWAGTFDEKFTDVFAVQDAISEKVAAALSLRLNEREQKLLTKHYTENTEAYQLYLQGRFYWNKYTEEGFRKSIEFFKQAVEKDPAYGLAYSGLADSYSLLGELGLVPANDVFPQARSYAEKAIALDETLASAHISLGIVKLFYDWDWPGAEKELRLAKELDPKNAQVYHFYGHYLELVGQVDEGIEETKRGVVLDPTNLIINSEVGLGYYFARKPDLAIVQLRKTLEMDPNFYYASFVLTQAYSLKHDYQAEIAEIERARPLSSDWSYLAAELGWVDASLGERTEALTVIEQLKDRRSREYIDPGLIVFIYTALGDFDNAFAWLDIAYQERSGVLGWITVEPKFDPLRVDPRFANLRRRMKLPLARD